MLDNINILILAAGNSTRMKSSIPKMLHKLSGKFILQYVINIAKKINKKNIFIIYSNNLVKKTINDKNINWIRQIETLGTGNAIKESIKKIKNKKNKILILYGDVPLISIKTIKKLISNISNKTIKLITAKLDNPYGYGRIVRKENNVIKIVEQNNATIEELKIKEVNSGIFITDIKYLKKWIKQINLNNTKKEYLITDIIHIAYKEKFKIITVQPKNKIEIMGINNKLELYNLEKKQQKEKLKKMILSGVIIKDIKNCYIRGKIKYGKNLVIDSNVIIEGKVTLGDNITIGTGCIIKNSIIKNKCEIKPYSILEDVILYENCSIGPFTHLRPGTIINESNSIGNFVEIKDSVIKSKSKIKHLSYIGNSSIGSKVNIGAFFVTCNYDGINKSKTKIGNNVFIGSSTQIVAPIKIVDKTTIAAGTTIIENTKTPGLIYNKKIQKHKKYWKISKKTKNK